MYTGKNYLNAKGKIRYGMMNDYIFRIVFQQNKYALKGLLCSVLGLKENHPEFCSTYQMRNAKDNFLYTDRFNLIVVSLNQIKLATDEDRANEIDKWARLFKSKTWEELIMIANDNKYMTSAAESVYLTNEDKNAIKIAREREEYLRHEAYQKEEIKKLKEQLTAVKAEKESALAEKESELSEKEALLQKYRDKFGNL